LFNVYRGIFIFEKNQIYMSFSNLFGTGEHSRNLGHFASIVSLAAVDGDINPSEEAQLRKFAAKLNIEEGEYEKVMQNPTSFPIEPSNSMDRRLERLYDLFKIIYSDHQLDEGEEELVKRYAIGLGFSEEAADKVIKRSIAIFSGISFDDYRYLLDRKA
jgi:uncharacterized tellurite resistance protein B-like protein